MPKGNKRRFCSKRIIIPLLLVVPVTYQLMGIFFMQKKTLPNNKATGSQLPSKRSRNSDNEDDILQAAVGEWTLIGFQTVRDAYGSDAIGQFCKLDWQMHKKNPSAVPMFRHLTQHCNKQNTVSLKLAQVLKKARQLDALDNTVKSIPPKGFVFHESRCGSTLVANSLATVDPEKNRVYSESAPLISAMKTANDESPEGIQFIKDIVYIMGRTNKIQEENLFFKIQSIGTTVMKGLRLAFPDVPWIFVYRDPVQVMMSHMPSAQTKQAVCLRSRLRPPPELRQFIEKTTSQSLHSLTLYESCATHLALLCSLILAENSSTNTGRMVNYKDFPNSLLDDIFPDYFGILVTSIGRSRVLRESSQYSKGGDNRSRTWKPDSQFKEKQATPELKNAADKFLYPIYNKLLET